MAIHLPSHNLYILLIYRPPSYDATQNQSLVDYIANFSVGKELILAGDFNLPSIKWNERIPDLHITNVDSAFLDLFNSFGFHQWINEPTFIYSNNILDLILTSDDDRVLDIDILPPFPRCGHCLIKFSYVFQGDIIHNDINNLHSLNWSRGKYSHIRRYLNQYDWDFELMHLDADSTSEMITSILTDLSLTYVPPKRPSKSSPPWHKSVPRNLFRRRSTAWKDYKNTRRLYGRTSQQALLKLALFNIANIELRSNTLQAQCDYETHLSDLRRTKPKLMCSYIRHKKVERPKIGPLKLNNNFTDDFSTMANIFVNSFASVFVDRPLHNPSAHQICNFRINSVEFRASDVEEYLRSLNTDSAMGPDNLHPRLLQECSHELSYPFSILFNRSFEAGNLPKKWKSSMVIPIYKKGLRSDPLNYRPISLNPIPCKIMERIIVKSLYSFLDDHLLLDNNQFGFRSGRSVTDQLLLTYDHVTSMYDQGHTVDLILFDYAKAFDKVHFLTLLDKLRSIGISGNLLNWIYSFLFGRSMHVSVSGHPSDSRPVLSGVPQGSVLGPLLFLIYINYIASEITCRYAMFADDLKLYLHLSTTQDPTAPSPELQHNIDTLCSISESWGLEFSPSKCFHLRFSRHLTLPVRNNYYYLSNSPIETVSSHGDLGVTVDTNLKFHTHIRNTVAKAGGVATNLLKSTVCRSANFMSSIFSTDIRPLLEFASPIWNTGYTYDLKLLESVQRRWTKQIEGLSTFSYSERLKFLNMYSTKGRLLRQDLIYTYKIFHDLSAIKPSDIFLLAPDIGTRGHRFKIFVQRPQVEARKRFFSHRVVQHWNALPSDVVDSPSLQVFKSRLHLALDNQLVDYAGY